MMKKYIPLITIFTVLSLTGCSSLSTADKQSKYPKSPDDVRRERAGNLFDGGFKLFNFKKGDDSVSNSPDVSVNGYLWRSALDTISFMPLTSADPVGGVIITDWYEDPAAKGERFKTNVLILSKNLSSNSVKVSVFKQIRKSGGWRDSKVNADVAQKLEDKILTRARELRIEQAN